MEQYCSDTFNLVDLGNHLHYNDDQLLYDFMQILNSAMLIGPALPVVSVAVVSVVAFLTVQYCGPLKMDSVDPTFDAEAQRGNGPEVQRSGTWFFSL